MIEFREVRKSFGAQEVLSGVNFSVGQGRICFVIGRSGVGKSVLLKNIVGLLQPDSGEIWVDGHMVCGLPEEQYFEVRRRCGMVFQHPALLDSISIYENIVFGLRAHHMFQSEALIKEQAIRSAAMVNLKPSILDRFPSELSLGTQKRVAIARALVLEPSYLLFDEPTTGQDPVATHAINHLIQKLSRELGVTSIVVSHDMHCALAIADQILMLEGGKIVAQGSPGEMLQSPIPIVSEFMAEAKLRSFDRSVLGEEE